MKLLKQLAIFGLIICFFSGVSCNRELKEHPIPPQVKKEMDARKKINDLAQFISGTIEFDSSTASKASKQGTLFIIARQEGVLNGPPLAVKRHSLIKFPFAFKIGQENVMLEGNAFEGNLTVTARWDLDGTPKASPADVDGSITVASGSTDVKIVLNHVIEAQKDSGNRTVSGVIRVDPRLADQIPEGASLFLIARSEGELKGIPLAVKKLQEVSFPHSFSLGQTDIMLPGALFEGSVTIFARLDRDGDAAPEPGDIDGFAVASSGDQHVEIILNHLIGS